MIFKRISSGEKVVVRWKPDKGKATTRTVTVKKSIARVTAPKARGRYKLTVTYRGKVLAKKTVRVT
jgi:hypothetical protein